MERTEVWANRATLLILIRNRLINRVKLM